MLENYQTTPDKLRAMIARIGISQRAAARILGISERQMRSYLAAPEKSTAIKAPPYIGLALEGIIARLEAVDIPDLECNSAIDNSKKLLKRL